MNEDWRALGAEAARFLREGQWSEAAATLVRLLEVNPDHADSRFNLGYALRHARRYGDALHAYGKAIALGVRHPEKAHLNRAVILSEHLHNNAGAQSDLEQAITASPISLPPGSPLRRYLVKLGLIEDAD